MFYGNAVFMITESAISSEICMSASSVVEPLPEKLMNASCKMAYERKFLSHSKGCY